MAAFYAYANAVAGTNGAITNGKKNIVLVTAGVKPTFGDAYLPAMLTYRMNAQLVGETKVTVATMNRSYGNLGVSTNNLT